MVKFRDFLTKPAGYATVLRRRRVLHRPVDPKSLIGAPELRPRIAHYYDDNHGFSEILLPALASIPTPPLPDRKDQIVRWVIARAKEGSSWRGLIALAAVAGWSVSESDGEVIIAFGMALAGVVGLIFPDAKTEG